MTDWIKSPYAMALSSLAALSVVFLVATGYILSHQFEVTFIKQIKTDIQNDNRNFFHQYNTLKIVSVVDAIDALVVRQADDGRPGLYLVTEADGSKIAGNMARWPDKVEPRAGWVDMELPLLGRSLFYTQAVDGNYRLLVGRQLSGWQSILEKMYQFIFLFILLILFVTLAAGYWIYRLFKRDIAEMNMVFSAFRSGDLQKRVEKKPRDMNMRILAGNVNDTGDHLQRLVDGMQKLSSTIAHELRSPLAKLRQKIESDQASLKSMDDLQNHVICALDDTMATFDSLLDVHDNETGLWSKREQVSLSMLAHEISALYRDTASAKNVRIRLECSEANVMGDQWLLKRLIANLVDNAIKHGSANGAITLGTYVHGDKSIFSIQSGWTGDEVKSLEELSLQRNKRAEENYNGGHGLGLRLVKAIATRHGAECQVSTSGSLLKIQISFSGPMH
jgi:signal transduction histidine kinase